MTAPQIRATHATRVVDLTARQQRNVSIVRALNDALRPVSETPAERRDRLAENLGLSIERRHRVAHRHGQPIDECLDEICTDYTAWREG